MNPSARRGSSVTLPWVIYFEAFYLHVVSSFSCIPVICPKFVLYLTPLQFMHLFCNVSKCRRTVEGTVISIVLKFGGRDESVFCDVFQRLFTREVILSLYYITVLTLLLCSSQAALKQKAHTIYAERCST